MTVLSIMSCTQDLLSTIDNTDCSFNEIKTTKSTQNEEIVAYRIIQDGYLEFVDNLYKIKFSSEQAEYLGYSLKGYEYLYNKLLIANELISQKIYEWNNNPNIKYCELKDCTYNNTDISLKNNTGPFFGTIYATLGYPSSISVFAPNGTLEIRGNCYNGVSLLAVNIVETNFLGSIISKIRIGSGDLNVNIAASNTYGSITYTTSDSYTSNYSWQLYPIIY